MERIPHLGSRGLSSPSKRHTDTQIPIKSRDYLDSASRKLPKLKTHNTEPWKYLDLAFRHITRDNPMHELPELPWVTPHVTPDESSSG